MKFLTALLSGSLCLTGALGALATPAMAQFGGETTHRWNSGDKPILVGDFNGDRKADIGVTAPQTEGMWYFRIGDGRGGFGSEYSYGWRTGGAHTPFVGDFNGDGYSDIGIVAPREEGLWWIRLNNKRGGFDTEYSYGWRTGVDRVFTGDFNGDGYSDLGVANPQGGQWFIRLNNRNRGFDSERTYNWVTGPGTIFTGDFDGDRYTDLGVTSPVNNGFWYVRFNDKNGSFGRELEYPWRTGVDRPFAGDFNGDGKADLGVTGARTTATNGDWFFRYNQGAAPVAPAPVAPAPAVPAPVAPDPAPAVARRYPIIFLPGVAGSFLNYGDTRVWLDLGLLTNSNLPFVPKTLEYLEMSADGQPKHAITPIDVMRKPQLVPGAAAPAPTVYHDFLVFLRNQGYKEGQNLFAFPYDFRLLPNDETTMKRLDETIARAKSLNRTDKVILIGHSMGGLVSRSYIVRGKGANVHALITIGTPWLGAPVAFKALGTEGWDFDILFLNKDVVRKLATNWPGAYTLLPAQEYLGAYPDGFFFQESKDAPIQTQEQQLAQARSFNPTLYDQSVNWRRSILDGNAYGVKNFVIVNGARNTIVRYNQKHEKGWFGEDKYSYPAPNLSLGDDTVPLQSGLFNGALSIGDFQPIRIDDASFNHSRLTEFAPVQNKVIEIISGLGTPRRVR